MNDQDAGDEREQYALFPGAAFDKCKRCGLHHAKGQCKQKPPGSWPKRKFRRANTILAGAVAFFAFVQAAVSYWQWDTMSRQTDLMEDQVRLSIMPQMAILRVEPFELRANVPSTITVVVKNVGNGPARNIRGQVGWEMTPDDPLGHDRYVAPVETLPPGQAIARNTTVIFQRSMRPTDEYWVAAVMAGEVGLYLFGRYAWDDLLGNPDRIDYCYRWMPRTGGWNTGGAQCTGLGPANPQITPGN